MGDRQRGRGEGKINREQFLKNQECRLEGGESRQSGRD